LANRFNRSFIDKYLDKHGPQLEQRQMIFDRSQKFTHDPFMNNMKTPQVKRASSIVNRDSHQDFINAKINQSNNFYIVSLFTSCTNINLVLEYRTPYKI